MEKRSYICVAGGNNIAVEVLKYLIDNYGSEKLCIISNKDDVGQNKTQRSLKLYAQLKGIPECEIEDIYTTDNAIVLLFESDMVVDYLRLKNARVYSVKFSAYNCDAKLAASIPILNGDEHSFVFLQSITSPQKTEELVDYEMFEISEKTAKEVYNSYVDYGTKIVLRNLDGIVNNRVKFISKEKIRARDIENNTFDTNIILNKKADEIQRQIRAFSYRDYYMPKAFNHNIIDCRILNSKSVSRPGTAIVEGDKYIVVNTLDYNVALYYDRFEELMEACEQGYSEKVKQICAVRRHINEQNQNGWSPLIKAVYGNQKEIVGYLIAAGADVYVKNRNGTNILMYAKGVYKRQKDNELFKFFKKMGFSEKNKDYYELDLIDYIEKDNIRLSELMA